jgi:hypothetical protein
MDCTNKGFGIADPNCTRYFVDCNTENQPHPFIAMHDVRRTRFRIADVKVTADMCETFCINYGGNAAVIDTDEKYKTVYKMTQKTNKEQNVKGNYVIGLVSKLMLGKNYLNLFQCMASYSKLIICSHPVAF